jgi:uncharacterized coiled-coil protein SlyX
VALLVAGGLAPLIIPAVGAKLTTDIAVGWLSGIGSNALASWVQDWAEKQGGKRARPAVEEQLARDLDQVVRHNSAVAADIVTMLDDIDALQVVDAALRGKVAEQRRFIHRLESDLANAQVENQRLRAWTESLINKLATAQTSTEISRGSATSTPAGIPTVGEQPPTGPPAEKNQQLLSDLLDID